MRATIGNHKKFSTIVLRASFREHVWLCYKETRSPSYFLPVLFNDVMELPSDVIVMCHTSFS